MLNNAAFAPSAMGRGWLVARPQTAMESLYYDSSENGRSVLPALSALRAPWEQELCDRAGRTRSPRQLGPLEFSHSVVCQTLIMLCF
jgi:hypothetical protein